MRFANNREKKTVNWLIIKIQIHTLGMFGKNDFGEDEKRGVENKRENGWKWCLGKRGWEEEEKNCETQLYSLWTH